MISTLYRNVSGIMVQVCKNNSFLFDFTTYSWKKLNFGNNFVPSERAAHAATALCEMQMFIYGGAASTQGLLKD